MSKTMSKTTPCFIWDALIKTPVVRAIKKGEEKLIRYTIPEFENVPDDKCWLCGGATNKIGIIKKKRISNMFSDVDYARMWTSKSLCMGCGGLLSNAAIRFYSILATEQELIHPTRKEWRKILLYPPTGQWAGCLSVSGQKHLFYRTEINFSNDKCIVVLEDFRIHYRPRELLKLLEIIESLLDTFSKNEIKTGRYNQKRIRLYGIEKWICAEEQILKVRGMGFFELALFVATKNDRKGE